jgi:hypothetical protein
VSNPDDASQRFSDAIDEILKGAPQLPPRDAEPPGQGRPASYDPYELPEIVQATVDVPLAEPAPAPVVTGPLPPAAPTPAVALPAQPGPTPAPVAAVAPALAPANQPPATSWGDHLPSTPATGAASSQLRAPGRRPRVRKVTRVVRHVDPWSTFKLALVFSMVGYLVVLTSGVLLWQVADSTGTLDNVERWFTQFGWETFEFDGGEIFHNAWIIGLFAAVGLTGAAVLMATLFNLVSDIVGGIRVTVLEEEVVERTASSARRYVVRRPPLAATGTTSWDVDDPAPPPATIAPDTSWSVDDDDPVAKPVAKPTG